jgi:hypothetical protein
MKMGGKAINVLVSDCHIYKKSKSQKVSSPPHQSVSSVTARLIATTVATSLNRRLQLCSGFFPDYSCGQDNGYLIILLPIIIACASNRWGKEKKLSSLYCHRHIQQKPLTTLGYCLGSSI